MSSYVTIAPDGSREVDVQSLFCDQIEMVRRIARMTEKCTICTPGVETPGFASVCVCKAMGGVVNGYVCDGNGNLSTVSDAMHAAQKRIAELEGELAAFAAGETGVMHDMESLRAERDDYRDRWEQTGCTRHSAMETAIKLAESYRQQLDDMAADRDRLRKDAAYVNDADVSIKSMAEQVNSWQRKMAKVCDDRHRLRFLLRSIYNDLPTNRDWLDPNLERSIREELENPDAN